MNTNTNADNDRNRKIAILYGLAGNYSANLGQDTLKLWLFLLAPYTHEQVQSAALAVIKKYGSKDVPYKSMPPFALMQKELDRLAGSANAEDTLHLKAQAEWHKLLENIETYGSYREPPMNRTTAYCVRSFGGWEQVCRWDMKTLHYREKDFIDLWESAHGKEDVLTLGCDAVDELTGTGFMRAPQLTGTRSAKALCLGA